MGRAVNLSGQSASPLPSLLPPSAHRILANGPLAIRATKESVLRGLAVTMKEAYKIESELSTMVFASEDAKEGPAAFAEKRAPNFKGR